MSSFFPPLVTGKETDIDLFCVVDASEFGLDVEDYLIGQSLLIISYKYVGYIIDLIWMCSPPGPILCTLCFLNLSSLCIMSIDLTERMALQSIDFVVRSFSIVN